MDIHSKKQPIRLIDFVALLAAWIMSSLLFCSVGIKPFWAIGSTLLMCIAGLSILNYLNNGSFRLTFNREDKE